MKTLSCLTLLAAACALADRPPKSLHPTVQKVVAEVSDDRIAATMKKLESFGTRNTNALPTSDPAKKGIVAISCALFQARTGSVSKAASTPPAHSCQARNQ